MARTIFQTLGLIVLVLGLGGATVDTHEGTGPLLRDLAWVGAGGVLLLAAISSALGERTRQSPTPPPAPQAWPQPQQHPGFGGQPGTEGQPHATPPPVPPQYGHPR